VLVLILLLYCLSVSRLFPYNIADLVYNSRCLYKFLSCHFVFFIISSVTLTGTIVNSEITSKLTRMSPFSHFFFFYFFTNSVEFFMLDKVFLSSVLVSERDVLLSCMFCEFIELTMGLSVFLFCEF